METTTQLPETDTLLVQRIREGDSDAWSELISRYEGHLLAFVESRLSNRSAGEDIVQETFVGFLISLPNFDGRRSLKSYLFSICAYKLTDHLRREGRRPTVSLSAGSDSSGEWQLPASAGEACDIACSKERKSLEETAITKALRTQVARWKQRGNWTKLRCIALLFHGLGNKAVAKSLNISEQQVASFKFDFIARTKSMISKRGLLDLSA